MNQIDFAAAFEHIKPYIVRISTPTVVGTGFLFTQSQDHSIVGIATAAHVVNDAHFWEQPIRIQHHQSGKTLMLKVLDRAIYIEQGMDTAAVVFQKGEIPFPMSEPKLSPEGLHLKIAKEIGWVGFPAVSPNDFCFFSGRISAWIDSQRAYLVDGVAINGVSGGPAFHPVEKGDIHVIGVVSAYVPNRATGETLPGLSIVRDVKQLQSIIKKFRNMDEAKQKESQPSTIANPPEEIPESKNDKAPIN